MDTLPRTFRANVVENAEVLRGLAAELGLSFTDTMLLCLLTTVTGIAVELNRLEELWPKS